MFEYVICGLGSMGIAIAEILKSKKIPFKVLKTKNNISKIAELGYDDIATECLDASRPLVLFLCYPDLVTTSKKWIASLNSNKVFFVCLTGWPIINRKWPSKSNVIMYAPKAIASKLKPKKCLIALNVHQETNEEARLLIELNKIFEPKQTITVSPLEETKSDLLSEQVLLCGWAPLIALLTYKKLIKSGIAKELAWEECTREASYIFETLANLGPDGFSKKISSLALRGGYKAIKKFPIREWDRMIDKMYSEIDNGNIFKSTNTSLPSESEAQKFWEELNNE
ncbi:MAG: hypothetical protein CL904_03560 [Dehalococcoidia bacterium]|nr:hypothetical protein [Dehalococcoidia bacterium]